MSNTPTQLGALADRYISRGARRGALLRYADSCRAEAEAATDGAERDEHLAEAAAAETAAAALLSEAGA